MAGEDPAVFNLLLDDLLAEHQPATSTEQILVEQMAHHHWINLRAARLLDREIELHLKLGVTLAKLGVFIRYQTAAERSFHKAHTELLKAQKQRQNSKIGFESKKPEVAPEAPPKQEPKIPFPTPAEPQEPNLRQEIAWIMSVTPDELRASNL